MHFLLWTKGSHQSPSFEIFKCSGENFPNSSCHFPNHKSVFLQIFYRCSVSCKISSLYFFRLNVIYFALKTEILKNFECLGQNSPNSCHFWNNKSFFLRILRHSSMSWDINLLYFFSWNFTYFQQNEPIKVQIWWNFTWAVESPKFCTLMGSFCPNHTKFQLEKYRRVISNDTEE